MDEIMFIEGLVPEEVLEHIGMPRRSGRYPWGSGENPYHHGQSSPGGRRKSKNSGEKRHLTDEQKRRLKIGAAAVGTALAVAGTVYLAKTGKLDNLASLGRAAVDRALEKTRNQSVTLASAKKQAADSMKKAAKVADKETVKKMKDVRKDRVNALKARVLLSDSEIDSRINRLEKEKKLKNLTKESINPGLHDVNDTLLNSGKKILGVTTAATGVVGVEYLLRRYFNDEMSKDELAKALKDNMRPKKK